MVVFNTEYFSTLDRGYYTKEARDEAVSRGVSVDFPEPVEQVTSLTARDIGTSEADIGQGTPLQHIQAAIRQGAAKVEFTFFGTNKSGAKK